MKTGSRPRSRSNPSRSRSRAAPAISAAALELSVQFSGAPGAFSFVLETAPIDSDGLYVGQGAAVAVADSNNFVIQRREIPDSHNFARLKFTALANNVNAVGSISPL
jgi:hypothetical protein